MEILMDRKDSGSPTLHGLVRMDVVFKEIDEVMGLIG